MTDYSNWHTPSGVSANQTEYESLPFPVPYWYWKHGSSNIAQGELGHYGRWNTGVEELDEIMGDRALADLAIEQRPKKNRSGQPTGETYAVYAKRYLSFAVIDWRIRWYTNPSTGKNNQHIQALVYLAERNEQKQVIPTIPAILTAKVFAAGELQNCFGRWFSFVKDLGTGKPPNLYYMVIGSFGETQKFEGSHGTSTLPVLFVPEKKPENLIFVGDEMAQKMRLLYDEAQAWLHDEAWLDPVNKQEENEPDEQADYSPTKQSEQIPF